MSGYMIHIRPPTPRDLEVWLDMRCALWPEGSRDDHRREIEAFLNGSAREPQAVLLAEIETPIGFAELSIRPYAEGCRSDRVAFLEGWYVSKNARRHGVGAALIAAAEQWGAAQGCSEFASDSQLDNDISRAAHAGCGFTEVTVIRCYRKELVKNSID
jgi:aminoglycoside 6'-N-acetyltransferase I